MNVGKLFGDKNEFKDVSDAFKATILQGKDKKSTQKATKGAVTKLKKYLQVKKLPHIEQISVEDLPNVLFHFYVEIKPKKDDDYSVQSFKCIRAALNSYFKSERGIDIIKNPEFVHPNEMFKGICVHSKSIGKGLKKSTGKITSSDLVKIGEYFNHDYMNFPNPKKLPTECHLFHHLLLLSEGQRKFVLNDTQHF